MAVIDFRKDVRRDFRKPFGKRDARQEPVAQTVVLPGDLVGTLQSPASARQLIVFVQAVAAAHEDPRDRAVAQALNQRGFATLLFDLVTPAEEEDGHVIFDIGRLAGRLEAVTHWLVADHDLGGHSLGFFAANTGAAAALVAAARLGRHIGAVVARGGQPDLAGACLDAISTPTLLIIGSKDSAVLAQNERALRRLGGPNALKVVSGAGHFFDEPGALTAATSHAAQWFADHLADEKPHGAGESAFCSNG